jgi:hypothetical protein
LINENFIRAPLLHILKRLSVMLAVFDMFLHTYFSSGKSMAQAFHGKPFNGAETPQIWGIDGEGVEVLRALRRRLG